VTERAVWAIAWGLSGLWKAFEVSYIHISLGLHTSNSEGE